MLYVIMFIYNAQCLKCQQRKSMLDALQKPMPTQPVLDTCLPVGPGAGALDEPEPNADAMVEPKPVHRQQQRTQE